MNEQDGLFVNVGEINEQRLLHSTGGMKSIPTPRIMRESIGLRG